MSLQATVVFTQILSVVSFAIVFSCVAVLLSGTVKTAGQLFYRRRVVETEMNRKDMFVTANPVLLFWANMFAFCVFTALAQIAVGSWILTGLVATGALTAPAWYWSRLRKQRFRKIEEQLPDAFMMIASSLQAGASINMAFQSASTQAPPPLSQELQLVVRKVQLGVNLDVALLEMERRAPIDSLIMASSAVRISREVGGNLVETIKSMADTLRRKFSMEGKIVSLTAQGKAQGRFMAFLPLLVGGGLALLDPDSMSKLISTPVGYAVSTVIVVMQVLGYVFINKTISIDT